MSSSGLSSVPRQSIVCISDDDSPLPFLAELGREFPGAVGEIWLAPSIDEASRARWQTVSSGGFKFVEQWEGWLGDPDLKVVIFSSSTPEQLDALRQLAGSGRAIFIYPRLEHELSLAYELSLLADQSPFDVVPVRIAFPRLLLTELRNAIRSGMLGSGVHLQLERKVCSAAGESSALLPQATLERGWVEDAAVLDYLAGPFSQLTATQAGGTGTGAALGQIIVGGGNGPQGVWTCSPGPQSSWKLTASGERGRFEIERAEDDSFQVVRDFSDQKSTTTIAAAEQYRSLMDQLQDFHSGTRHPAGLRELIRSFELLDASRRSLKRRRTIDLYYDAPTERGNFKTQMAAIGCGVLLYTLFAILVSLGAGEILRQIHVSPENPNQVILSPWANLLMIVLRIATFAPLGVFLSLQFLLALTRTSRDR